MYAVIRTGGKQYRVKAGDVLEIEHLSDKGDDVSFTPILVSTDDGRTLIGNEAGAYPVAAKMLGDAKGDKVIVFKYKNKSGYAVRNGHRQLYSLIEITSIGGGNGSERTPAEAGVAAPAEAAPVPDES
ncbi:MAG TPA: 50S ribosomal protein L21 [Actinomycetota bacterium]|nr:50S ribosomal protein L21 [Actinomycetota bacterium]